MKTGMDLLPLLIDTLVSSLLSASVMLHLITFLVLAVVESYHTIEGAEDRNLKTLSLTVHHQHHCIHAVVLSA